MNIVKYYNGKELTMIIERHIDTITSRFEKKKYMKDIMQTLE